MVERTANAGTSLADAAVPDEKLTQEDIRCLLKYCQQKWEPVLRLEPKAGAKRPKCDQTITSSLFSGSGFIEQALEAGARGRV